MKLIDYIESVELKTDDTNKLRFYFGEQPTLRGRRVMYALHYNSPSFLTPTGRSSLGTVVNESFLVLVSKNREAINRYPLRYLDGSSLGLLRTTPIEINRIIDWSKSYIELPDNTNLAADESFYFTFLCADRYVDPPQGVGLNIEVIEVKTNPITVTKFAFPDHENLRNKRIAKIEFLWDTTNIQLAPSGADTVNGTVRNKSVLTMVEKGNEVIRKIPLEIIECAFMYGKNINLDLVPDLSKCYVEISNTTGLVADEAYVFLLYYYDKTIGKK